MSGVEPLPVHVLTGFLGSGKTTLLQRLLTDEAFGDTAVLVNEFGDVALDHNLLSSISPDVVLLSSGCVCCTIRGELSEALRFLLSQRADGKVPPFKRIVLETTGLADPGPIASTLAADPVLRHQVRCGSAVAVVDGVHAEHSHRLEPVWARQVALADFVVLSKIDLIDAMSIGTVRALVKAVNPTAQVLESIGSAVLTDLFTARAEAWLPAKVQSWLGEAHSRTIFPDLGATHVDNVQSFTIEFDMVIDWTCFGMWLSLLLHRHGGDILRVKGVLCTHEDLRPLLLNGVQHIIHPPEHLNHWPETTSQLVFITRGIDGERVLDSLRYFTNHASDLPSPNVRLVSKIQRHSPKNSDG